MERGRSRILKTRLSSDLAVVDANANRSIHENHRGLAIGKTVKNANCWLTERKLIGKVTGKRLGTNSL
jgi:hypothetical protein